MLTLHTKKKSFHFDMRNLLKKIEGKYNSKFHQTIYCGFISKKHAEADIKGMKCKPWCKYGKTVIHLLVLYN